MRAAALLGALLVLGALPSAGAAPDPVRGVDLQVAQGFEIASGTLLSGRLAAPGLSFSNASLVEPRALTFGSGNLTVCPITAPRSGLVPALLILGADCPDGESFQDPTLRFSPATHLVLAGRVDVDALPDAGLALVSAGDARLAIVLGPGGLRLAPDGGIARFAATNAAASVTVFADGAERTYNGTRHAFLLEAPSLRWEAGGVTAQTHGLELRATPAGAEATRMAFRPDVFLALQEAALGPDAREPRSNVTAVVGEFGRVPAFVDGALLGRLRGRVAGQELDGGAPALVRFDNLTVRLDGDRLMGTAEPRLAVTPAGIAVAGGDPRSPPWAVGIVLWILAAAAVALHRRPPVRRLAHRLAWAAAGAAAFLLVDLHRMPGLLGTSALGLAGAPPRAMLALAVFETAAVGLAFVLLALPVRVTLGRVVPPRFLLASEAAWAVLWVLIVWALPAQVLAWGHSVARL